MKKANLKTIAILSSTFLISTYGDKVQLQDLPASVQTKIRNQIGASAEINDIDREVRNGKTTYQVGFKNNGGPQNEISFNQNGDLRRTGSSAAVSSTAVSDDTSADLSTMAGQKISRSELPVPVRRVVDSRLQGMEINTIERIAKDGQTRYGIGYKQAGGVGAQQELLLSDNGTILHSSAGLTSPSSVASSSSTIGSSTVGSSSIGSSPTTSQTSVSSRVITYNDVPESVRTIVDANVKNAAVRHVERQLRNGEVDYQIDLLTSNGQYQEMLISEDGRILQNQVMQSTGVGSPGTVQSGSSTSTTTTNSSGNFFNRLGRALFDQQQQ
jgi:hypothetical protein